MIITILNENKHMVKINDYSINIFDKKEVEVLIRKVIMKVYKSKMIQGLINFDIYLDKHQELVIVADKENDINTDIVEVKIVFHIDTDILYQIDQSYIFKNSKQQIYYYRDKFYLYFKEKPSLKEQYQISEFGTIIIGKEAIDIKNHGVKISQS